jgi:Pyridoxamine 5'-phosphate oxidase
MIDDETLQTQQRGRRIAMTAAEIDDFLARERTCRVATLTSSGAPHISPLWFVWDGHSLWLNSLVKSERWADVVRDSRVAVTVDAGTDFQELHGVELRGRLEIVGDVPRPPGRPALPEVSKPEELFASKYGGMADGSMYHDGRHGWLRLTPTKIASWHHGKIGT